MHPVWVGAYRSEAALLAGAVRAVATAGRLISDDHGARAVARNQYQVRASSTVGVLTELLAHGLVTPETADLYLDTLRTHRRMGVTLTSGDLLSRNLGPWQ
jgi:predicted nucleic acid-binding protein